MGNQWGTALVLWAGGCLWSALLLKGRFFFVVVGWLYFCSTELFAFKQPAWEESQCYLSGARRGKRPLVSHDPALPSQGNRCIKYCQCWFMLPLSQSCSSGPAGLCCQSCYTGRKIKSQLNLLAQFCGIIIFLVRIFAHCSWFEAAFWDLFELLTFRETTELLPYPVFLVSSHFL